MMRCRIEARLVTRKTRTIDRQPPTIDFSEIYIFDVFFLLLSGTCFWGWDFSPLSVPFLYLYCDRNGHDCFTLHNHHS